MNAEVDTWLRFAEENLRVAEMCTAEGLYNPAIQNAQQSVEKALKACCLYRSLGIKKTHSIGELAGILQASGVEPLLSEDECALLDSVYLPSKYPLGSVLPDYDPDLEVTTRCVTLANRTLHEVRRIAAADQE